MIRSTAQKELIHIRRTTIANSIVELSRTQTQRKLLFAAFFLALFIFRYVSPLFLQIYTNRISTEHIQICRSCQFAHHGRTRILSPLFQPPKIGIHAHPMGLLNVPFRTPLVHLRMQILQTEDLSTLHQQSLNQDPASEGGGTWDLGDVFFLPVSQSWCLESLLYD